LMLASQGLISSLPEVDSTFIEHDELLVGS
jgi:hypothetical protein